MQLSNVQITDIKIVSSTQEQCQDEDNSTISTTTKNTVNFSSDSDSCAPMPKEHKLIKVPKHVVDTMKDKLKSKSKCLKELKMRHDDAAQQIGRKDCQIQKLHEDKKDLAGQCRDLQRRHETLEKNSRTIAEAHAASLEQHKEQKKRHAPMKNFAKLIEC